MLENYIGVIYGNNIYGIVYDRFTLKKIELNNKDEFEFKRKFTDDDDKFDKYIFFITIVVENEKNYNDFVNWYNKHFKRTSLQFQFDESTITLLYKKGTYKSTNPIEVGFKTGIWGLGSQEDINISSFTIKAVADENNTFTGLDNFWRSIKNFTVTDNELILAVSQSVGLWNIHFDDKSNGVLKLFDKAAYVSGGFLFNTNAKDIKMGGQQQFNINNTDIDIKEYKMWNCVQTNSKQFKNFNEIKQEERNSRINLKYTKVPPSLEYDEEKKKLILKDYNLIHNYKKGSFLLSSLDYSIVNDIKIIYPPDNYYDDSSTIINETLKNYKAVLLAPGRYYLKNKIEINKSITKYNVKILMGIGLVTIMSDNESGILTTENEHPGIIIHSILFEAINKLNDPNKEMNFKSLINIGNETTENKSNTPKNFLIDVYIKYGGSLTPNRKYDLLNKESLCDCLITVNSNNVMVINFWGWRADHFIIKNGTIFRNPYLYFPLKNNIIINGIDNIFLCLMVEHGANSNCIINGNNNSIIFFQNEFAYELNPNPDEKNERVIYKVKDNKYLDLNENDIYNFEVNDNVEDLTTIGIGCYNSYRFNNPQYGKDAIFKIPNKYLPNVFQDITKVDWKKNTNFNLQHVMLRSSRVPNVGNVLYTTDIFDYNNNSNIIDKYIKNNNNIIGKDLLNKIESKEISEKGAIKYFSNDFDREVKKN